MKRDIYNEEESIRKLIETTKIKAPENLKYRIMNQIESEKAITPKQAPRGVVYKKKSANVLRDLNSIFGTMYGVLAIMILGAYFLQGREFLLSSQFIGTIILVSSVFSLFWLISRVDANLKDRKNKKTIDRITK